MLRRQVSSAGVDIELLTAEVDLGPRQLAPKPSLTNHRLSCISGLAAGDGWSAMLGSDLIAWCVANGITSIQMRR